MQPGQRVVFELGFTSGRIEALVTYARQLKGGVFEHYSQKQGVHGFWNVPLARLYDRPAFQQNQQEALRVDFCAMPSPPNATATPIELP